MTHMHDAQWVRRAQRDIREILNEWDPLGVYGFDDPDLSPPPDEYDCLRDPLIGKLARGDSREEIVSFVQRELSGHFGMPANSNVDDLVERIASWRENLG